MQIHLFGVMKAAVTKHTEILGRGTLDCESGRNRAMDVRRRYTYRMEIFHAYIIMWYADSTHTI